MRHRIVNFGVSNRYVVRTIADSANDSSPIPVWKMASAQTETDEIKKLKRFCLQQYAYLQEPLIQENHSPQKKPVPHFITFLSFGIYLCLNALTSFHSFSSNTQPDSTNSHANPVQAGTMQKLPSLFHWKQSKSIQKSLVENAANSNSQEKAKAALSNKAALGFVSPVQGFPVTSTFGNRVHPILGGYSFHQGIDIATPNGTPIKAAKAGHVIFAGLHGGYGRKVVIHHGEGYQTLYAHLDELLVEVGDRVEREEVIGLSGSTGYVTGPHLHFEIHFNQVAHNPMDYF